MEGRNCRLALIRELSGRKRREAEKEYECCVEVNVVLKSRSEGSVEGREG